VWPDRNQERCRLKGVVSVAGEAMIEEGSVRGRQAVGRECVVQCLFTKWWAVG
jgi:hypothetical protein